jgi:hypothetical protein
MSKCLNNQILWLNFTSNQTFNLFLPASAAVVVLSLAPCTIRQQIETNLFALAPATIAIAALSANGILQM